MTTEYVRRLVAAYPSVREVWLYGSRANGTAGPDSDWDYLAFADDDTLSVLSRDVPFHLPGIDLMVVVDGVQFAKPWVDDGGQKTGSLADDVSVSGLAWKAVSASEARYMETTPRDDNNPLGFYSVRRERRAVRVFPTDPSISSPEISGPVIVP